MPRNLHRCTCLRFISVLQPPPAASWNALASASSSATRGVGGVPSWLRSHDLVRKTSNRRPYLLNLRFDPRYIFCRQNTQPSSHQRFLQCCQLVQSYNRWQQKSSLFPFDQLHIVPGLHLLARDPCHHNVTIPGIQQHECRAPLNTPLICIRECEQDDFTNLIVPHVLFQLIINGIRIIISGEELFGGQVCPRLFFIRGFVDQNDHSNRFVRLEFFE